MKDRRILVFGGSGSLGKQLISRLAVDNSIVVFSRDEAKHWEIRNSIPKEWGVEFIVGDMRDYQAVELAIKRTSAEVIIIASALKQVDTCEKFPAESVKTNIIGVQNVVDACDAVPAPLVHTPVNNEDGKGLKWRALTRRTVLMVSTDKACSPINVYGMCKGLAERIVTERGRHSSNTRYVAVRYGNVLESRGSVIPLFRKQAESGEVFTLTHDVMTRFVMTLDESIDLIVDTLEHARSGDMWIPKLKSMKIRDLAEIFSARYDKPVKAMGIRPGEKLHESLINDSESLRTSEIRVTTQTTRTEPSSHERYVVGPAWNTKIKLPKMPFAYTSADDVMTRDELEEYLKEKGVFDGPFSGV